MFTHIKRQQQKGFTYIELILVASITVIIFGAILVAFQYALKLGYTTRVKLSALSLANDRMELFRSLPYDDVALTSDFPPGAIPQTSTFVLNGFTINERVRIDQVDDPADGSGLLALGGTDTNNIITDYRKIKVEYTWTLDGTPGQLSLLSNIVPRSIETDLGGGTIRINVLDADGTPLPSATVQVIGASSTAPYDRTILSGIRGEALFTVAAASGYQTFVSALIAGQRYSTSSTYVATVSNPVPTVAPFSVVEAGISTLTFQIGALSDLLISLKSDITEGSTKESFSDTSSLATSTNVVVNAGQLELANRFGVYDAAGTAYLQPIVPANILSWEIVRVAADIPPDTDYRIQFYVSSTTENTLIPEVDLPGNDSGFTDTLLDISRLDPDLYPTITIGINFVTSDTSVTPSIQELETFWRSGETVLGGQDIFLRGDKMIGAASDMSPIYKTTANATTDTDGKVLLEAVEFDTYQVKPVTTYSLVTACPAHPFSHQAGIDGDLELVYINQVATNVRVSVVDTLGRAIPGVSVRLRRGAYDISQDTNTCGQTFFAGGGLAAAADYELTITAPGYATELIDSFEIAGETPVTVTLTP